MDITHIVQPQSTASKTDPADVIMWSSSTPSSSASQPHPGQGQPTTTSHCFNTPAFPGPLLVVDRDHDREGNGDRQRTLLPAAHTRTALLLIDIQRGLNTSNGYFGSDRATPTLEGNVATLLSRCREYNARVAEMNSTTTTTTTTSAYPIQMIHVFHQSSNPASPLHVSGRAQKDGIEFMPCAAPDDSSAFETVLAKRANSAFADGRLKRLLAEKRIGQLVVVGIATDHCVSSSVRWAKDLGVVKRDWDRALHHGGGGGGGGMAIGETEAEMDNEGTIVVVRDATACFGKGGVGAEMVQRVSLASLEGEFADLLCTADVLDELFG
ncbi:hypothetical protein G647_04359 [Cladophialophora carrionii CBS 160.54]|uniref:Isochorismatase-like domain-containing protein n=1 Tax=Cladophialophora carrionii CBS 160.54 TaxID=1279043 RepID=V9DDL2_9EURO|nr:uncharacterized protein G647_04359 [Cladophialophora carrionii CBS 160.54]ETI24989.1 hypothetical protein G647_04359 [Cladophialophora carrionii CBS 160.54]